MRSTIRLLTIILIVQVAVSVFTFTSDDTLATFKAEEPLVNLSLEQLSKIQITVREKDAEDRVLTLEKTDGEWILPDYFSFPVASKKLDTFRDKLFTLKKPFPVGSTASAAKQFEVSEEKFQTKVEFLNGEKVVDTLYLGSSPSFKKVHISTQEDPLSYSVGYSGFELRAKEKSWIDKSYLNTDRTEVKSIQLADYSLEQAEDGKAFTLSDLNSETEEVNTSKMSTLVKAITEPTFLDILGTEAKEEYGLSAPELEYTVTTSDDSSKTYKYGKVGEQSHYALQVSGDDKIFKVSSFQVEKIKDATRDSLVKAVEVEASEDAVEETTTESVAPEMTSEETSNQE